MFIYPYIYKLGNREQFLLQKKMRKWEGWNYNANLDQPHGDDSVVGKE